MFSRWCSPGTRGWHCWHHGHRWYGGWVNWSILSRSKWTTCQCSAAQPSSVSSGPSSGHATTFSLASLPCLYPPNITPSPILNDHGPPVVSLNSLEHSPLEPANRVFSFSSDFQSTASSHHSTPLDSGDSDASASWAMNALCVGSHKSKSLWSLSSNTSTQSASPQVSGASCPPSTASHKRPNEHPASAMADQMSKTAESLMMHLDKKHELHAEQWSITSAWSWRIGI